MKNNCCKIVACTAIIGAIGSVMGWYWDCFLDCLGQDIHHVHFGVALVWIILACLVVRALNHLIFKD